MEDPGPKTKIAERLWSRPGGATMREVIAATGTPQYNELKRLKARGYAIRRVKEGNETRYFAVPSDPPAFEGTLTSKGQVTVPKEIRKHLRLGAGSKLYFTLNSDGRVVIAPAMLSIRRLVGKLGKPRRHLRLKEMDDAIRQAAVEKYLRSRQ
jgi:AbrB family looped-hinge helix DNA binding protein